MRKEQITKQLKEYYLEDLTLDVVIAYYASEAYNNRKRCIESAWSDRGQWKQLKASLTDLSAEIWDYSFLGEALHITFPSASSRMKTFYILYLSVLFHPISRSGYGSVQSEKIIYPCKRC
ncbi:hypothetical protein [Sphingobacterium sp. UBA1498]|uniref:hypothetical protein n=1 Tax=Sphingobacterium sp. UBA1498 TaxID=1947481 RepID=UPI0025CD891E|nr:hypothetical protein [Sphingobacterium sp. UBA1498]